MLRLITPHLSPLVLFYSGKLSASPCPICKSDLREKVSQQDTFCISKTSNLRYSEYGLLPLLLCPKRAPGQLGGSDRSPENRQLTGQRRSRTPHCSCPRGAGTPARTISNSDRRHTAPQRRVPLARPGLGRACARRRPRRRHGVSGLPQTRRCGCGIAWGSTVPAARHRRHGTGATAGPRFSGGGGCESHPAPTRCRLDRISPAARRPPCVLLPWEQRAPVRPGAGRGCGGEGERDRNRDRRPAETVPTLRRWGRGCWRGHWAERLAQSPLLRGRCRRQPCPPGRNARPPGRGAPGWDVR